MRFALLVLVLASAVALAKSRPTTIAFNGAAFQLPSSGSSADPSVEPVRYGPKPGQEIVVRTQSWHHKDVTYTLTVTRFPDRLRNATDAAVLAGARRGLLGPSGTGGEQEVYEARDVDGHPGFALRLRAGRQRVRARVAFGEGRLIQLTAVGVERAVTSDAVTKSLDSLAFAAWRDE